MKASPSPFSRIATLLVVGTALLLSVSIFLWSYKISDDLLLLQTEDHVARNQKLAQAHLTNRHERLQAEVELLQRSTRLAQYIERDDKANAQIALHHALATADAQALDLVFVVVPGEAGWVDASNPLSETGPILRQIGPLKPGVVFPKIVGAPGKAGDVAALVAGAPIKSPDTGKVVGLLVGGVVINNNQRLLGELGRLLEATDVGLLWGDTWLARPPSPQAQDRLAEAHQVLGGEGLVQHDSFLYHKERFRLDGVATPLSLVAYEPDRWFSSLRQRFARSGVFFGGIAVLLMIGMALWIRRLVVGPMRELVDYATLSADQRAAFQPTSIVEFNTVGQAVDDLATKLWSANFSLQEEVTERRATQAKLHRTSRDLQATLDALEEAVLVVGPDGRIRDTNPAALKLLGVAESQATGLPLQHVFQPRAVRPDQTLPGLFESGDATDAVLDTHVGGRRVLVTRSERKDAHGKPDGEVVVVRDITQQLELTEQLRQSQKLEGVGLLAGGVAHDFNNLLTAIRGNAQLLELIADVANKEQILEHAGEILAASDRAADLTSQLLAFSRRGKLQNIPVDVHVVLGEVGRLLRRTLPKNISLDIETGASNPCMVGDPTSIHSAILNLALNARDAMPDGGQLRVRTFNEPEDMVALEVSDNGTGIPKSIQKKVFEPFFTTKAVGAGTGLGLSAVYGTVKSHHGELDLRSEPSQGTVFTLRFPAVAAGPSAPVKQAMIDGGERAILVVDDEAGVRNMAVTALKTANFIVQDAEDGESAIVLAEHVHFDAALVDLSMPGMHGSEVLKKLKASHPHMRVVLMSGFDLVKSDPALTEGADGFLNKPFTIATMVERLDTALKSGG